MRRNLVTKTLTIATVLVLGGALATAWASVPDRAGNVRTCYSKKSGDLRVLKSAKSKCSKKKERALTLNQRGRTGAQGPRGPVGPSNAYVVRPSNFSQVVSSGKKVASLSLPAGSYAVNAMVRVLGGASATNADCSLAVASNYVIGGNVNVAPSPDRKLIPLTDVVVLPAPGSVDMYCTITSGGSYSVDEIRITAVGVGAVAVQGP